MPLCTSNFYLSVLIRALQGLGVTSVYAAHGTIPHSWGKPTEQGLLVSLLSCSYELAPILSMALSGYFCSSSLGWPVTYYLFGSTTVLSFCLFFLVYSNTDRKLKPFDLSIEVFTTDVEKPKEPSKSAVPYKSIFSSPSVWGVWMTALGDAVGYQMFIMYGPIYINKVLHYEIAKTGLLASFPFLLSIGTKFLGGMFIDKATCVGDHARIIFFTSFSQAAMTACFLMLTFLSADSYVLAQAVFTLTIVFSGLHCVGTFSGSQSVS
ncbi:hypothetical protein L596_029116 [Steinernema carpocapsae]|uniref:Major facilitator superfamily (MFS) profile domain-containing protein n=1 Tax=Steinernema carpocapsae TaxID=34508 RepID=A0A4U5LTQ3_STECR|nr:hypothetical protein L596_029116 [Steinernema carpocapsae]